MDVTRVEDPSDDRLADYRGLTDVALRRRLEPEHGLYMAESAKVIARALDAGHEPRSVMTTERWLPDVERLLSARADPSDAPVYLVSDAVAEGVTGYVVHRGMLAAMQRPPVRPVADVLREMRGERSRIAILEDLVDHTNVGACFRSAAALGVDAVLVTPRCADPLYRRSIRVSMGTVFQVPWTRIDPWPGGIDALREAGYAVAGMTLGDGAVTMDELVAEEHRRLALVFGMEGEGLTAAA
ncbi:MAG: TrmH family RNA methyltransferase, partial [Microbacterium sp.]